MGLVSKKKPPNKAFLDVGDRPDQDGNSNQVNLFND